MSSVPAAFSPTNKIYFICSNTYPIPPTYIMFRWQQPFLLRLTNIIFKNVVLMYIVKIQLLQCLFTHGQIPSFLFGCQTDCEKSKNMSYCFSSMYAWLLGQTYTYTHTHLLSLIVPLRPLRYSFNRPSSAHVFHRAGNSLIHSSLICSFSHFAQIK